MKLFLLTMIFIQYSFAAPNVSCEGGLIITDPMSKAVHFRVENFNVDIKLSGENNSFQGMGSVLLHGTYQVDLMVNALINPLGVTINWLKLDADTTTVENGKFTSVGISESEEFNIANSNDFESKTRLANGALYSKIKNTLGTASTSNQSLENYMQQGLVKPGEIAGVAIGKCHIIGR